MIPLFLGITLANFIALGTAVILGYRATADPSGGQWHRLVGALAAIVCCGVHCVVFTYFIATAKWVRHAISLKSLDPALLAPTRSFKAQAFPAALASMFMVFVTAMMGAAADNYLISPAWHHLTALAMLATNLGAACVEFVAVRRNGALIDRILAQVNAQVNGPAVLSGDGRRTNDAPVAERQTLGT